MYIPSIFPAILLLVHYRKSIPLRGNLVLGILNAQILKFVNTLHINFVGVISYYLGMSMFICIITFYLIFAQNYWPSLNYRDLFFKQEFLHPLVLYYCIKPWCCIFQLYFESGYLIQNTTEIYSITGLYNKTEPKDVKILV